MEPANGRLYRLCHKPNILIDIYPTDLWNYDSLIPDETALQNSIPSNSPIEEQFERLRQYSPSFNISDSGAASIL